LFFCDLLFVGFQKSTTNHKKARFRYLEHANKQEEAKAVWKDMKASKALHFFISLCHFRQNDGNFAWFASYQLSIKWRTSI